MPCECMNNACERRMEPLIVAGGEKRKPVFAPYYKGGRRLHIGMAEFAEDFGGSVSKAALGSVSVMKMAAGYLGKAVVASKVEKQTEKAGVALDPASAAAAAAEQEGGSALLLLVLLGYASSFLDILGRASSFLDILGPCGYTEDAHSQCLGAISWAELFRHLSEAYAHSQAF